MKINFEDLPLGFTWLPAIGVATKVEHPSSIAVTDPYGYSRIDDTGISYFNLWENRSCLLPKEFI